MLNTANNQNNMLPIQTNLQQKLQDRRVFEKFLNKTEFVTADKPRGSLVKESIPEQFGAIFTDTAKDVKNLGNALAHGKSNDHELGRMNDLGMKIGGGLIAAALMGKRNTTNKKLMEVLGFGTFFSTMALWPKVMIDAPTKLMHGFNPHQKYIDSQGRKKQFFQDNQYLPWDVWTKEEINKVADKMGVPKDLKDREEYTKEKMRTIALQDNTLWMLTAGFAAPLVTSIACNRIEEGIKVPVANAQLRNLANPNQTTNMINKTLNNGEIFASNDNAMSEILATLRRGEMPENLSEKLAKTFDLSSVTTNNSLKDNLNKKLPTYTEDFVNRLFPKNGSFVQDSFVRALVGEDASDDVFVEAKSLLQEAYEQLAKQAAAKGKGAESIDLQDVISNLDNLINEKAFNQGTLEIKDWMDDIAGQFDSIPSSVKKVGTTQTGYDKKVLSSGADVLENLYNEVVKPSQAAVRTFGSQIEVLNNVSGEKYNRSAKTLLDALNFSDKEIKVLRNSNAAFGDTLQEAIANKFAEIAKDDNKYNAVLKTLEKEEQRIERVKQGGKEITIGSTFDSLKDRVNGALKKAGEKFKGTSVEDTDLAKYFANGLSKQEIETAKSSATAVDSMISRMRAALELEKRIQDGTLIKDFEKFADLNEYKDELKYCEDQFYQTARKIVWQSSYGDIMNKCYLTGNGAFFKTMSDAVFNGEGEKSWKTVAKCLLDDTAYLPNDPGYIPNPRLDVGLKAALKKAYIELKIELQNKTPDFDWCGFEANHKDLAQELRRKAAEKVGCPPEYVEELFKTHNLKFADLGESTLSALKKQIETRFNDKNLWMKTFGGLTAALIGLTLISQLFFGKVKNAELYEKAAPQINNNGDTFESEK